MIIEILPMAILFGLSVGVLLGISFLTIEICIRIDLWLEKRRNKK